MGFMAAFMPALGKAAAGGAVSFLGSVLGGRQDRKRDQQALGDRYDFLESKGLTPQEIAGSGAASGGPSGAAAQVLGNSATKMAQLAEQQRYDQEQRELDRQVAIRGQDASIQNTQTAANASIASSSLSAGATRYSSDNAVSIAEMNNALARDRFNNIDLPQALNRLVTTAPAWERARIMAQMGVDNMIGTAIGNKYGLNPMDPAALENMSETQFKQMVTDIYGIQSTLFGEAAGAVAIGSNLPSVLGGRGSPASGAPNRPAGSSGRR